MIYSGPWGSRTWNPLSYVPQRAHATQGQAKRQCRRDKIRASKTWKKWPTQLGCFRAATQDLEFGTKPTSPVAIALFCSDQTIVEKITKHFWMPMHCYWETWFRITSMICNNIIWHKVLSWQDRAKRIGLLCCSKASISTINRIFHWNGCPTYQNLVWLSCWCWANL